MSGICSIALVNMFMNDLDKNTKDVLTKLWIAQSLGGGEDQGSEHGKQKHQDPKQIKLLSKVLALTFYKLTNTEHLVYIMLRTMGFRDK